MGLCQSAYSLSVYTYFVDRRSYAVGLSETITGFGPILIPQMISVLMTIYTPEGVTLIFGGICAHVFIAATLLQPVKWHMKIKEEKQGETVEIQMKSNLTNTEEKKEEPKEETNSDSTEKTTDTHNNDVVTENDNASNQEKTDEHDKQDTKNVENGEDTIKEPRSTEKAEGEHNSEKKLKENIFITIVRMFDLDLLKDPIFVNIMMGLALAIFAELNFTVLTPFMLHDYGLDTSQIAIFLSVLGGADIVFRFFAPHIANLFTTSPRWMYAGSLFLLMLTRFSE
mgnify:FL=1